ncbi:MAG TPA: sigma-70 family RNA polymerase sigma factor [Anaerolineae bacterium]|nr:sigma-70 family RNA polymerase sigma factor [Anaerolineae bacterium]
MQTSDSLLKCIRQWDENALTKVYDQYAPAIYRYAYRLTGHAQTAQEIVSDTFYRLLLALKNGGGPEQHLSAWLYRVAHNLIVDFYRRQPEQDQVTLDEALHVAVSDMHEERILRREEAERVRHALWLLTPLQQQIITLRFLEGLTNEEVAQCVERTVGAVKALQHRALDSLRRVLEKVDEAQN